MKSMVHLIIILALSLAGTAQENKNDPGAFDNSNDLHRIMQIEGTNEAVMEFFNETLIPFPNDSLYVIIVPPMKCARCEGVINPFIYEIKKIDPDAVTALVAFYPKNDALKHYLRKRRFIADHIIASTDDEFLSNFIFSSGSIQVPFITKINISTGDLVAGKSTLGLDMNNSFAQWMYDSKEPCEKAKSFLSAENKKDKGGVPHFNIDKQGIKILKPFEEIVLGEEDGYPISRPLYPAFNPDLSYFAFMDELTYEIYLYYLSPAGSIFTRSVKVTPEDERLFISPQIGDTLLLLLKRMNIVNPMFFSSSFLNDTIIVTASLPNIFWQDTINESLAYYNKITYIYRGIKNDSLLHYLSPAQLEDSVYVLEHLNTYFLDNGKLIIIPVSKGWPVTGTQTLDKSDRTNNPFLDSFYNDTPIFAVYDKHGDFISYAGNLDPIFKKYRVGYAFSKPVARYYNDMLWYTDTYSGKIKNGQLLKNSKVNHEIEVFKVPDYASGLNAEDDPLAYIRDFNDLFNQAIIDFRIHDDKIYTLLKQNEYYSCKIFNLKGKLLSHRFIPTIYDHMDINTALLSINNNHKRIIGIFESEILTSILYFDLE